MKDLYYVVEENGYHIYDRNDGLFHVHQYEPFIADKSKTYEENAQAQIHEYMVSDYSSEVVNGAMTIEEVPKEYREEVEIIVNNEVDRLRQEGYDQAVLDMIESGVL